MMLSFLMAAFLFAASALGQSADITGWSDLRWGATKPVVLKTLQPLGAHDCKSNNTPSCAEAAGADVVVVEKFNFNNVPFMVTLFFAPKDGLNKAIMTAENTRDAFEKMLSALTIRYGKPGLQSEYDGDTERTYTSWIWLKAHGKLSLASEETGGIFTMTFESQR